MSKKFTLSASRIKTFLGCSWEYYCKYVLKLPDTSNDGARRGSCAHSIFEYLLMPKHKKHYDIITQAKDVKASPAVFRLILLLMKKEELGLISPKKEDNLQMILDMVLVGLQADFYCEGKKLEKGELEILIETVDYSIIGYIDKLATEQKTKKVSIYDYKSSAKVESHEIQALTYALWAKRVALADSAARFIYLRKPDGVKFSDYEFSDGELNGFEVFLKELYAYLKDFDEEKARVDFAAHRGYPTKDEGFCKLLKCGRAKSPGELKKDGSPMWSCAYKFNQNYFVALDKEGKIVYSSKQKIEPKDGLTVEERQYSGCPAFNV